MTTLETAVSRSRNLRPRTKELYLQHVRAFITFVEETQKPSTVSEANFTEDAVVAWRDDMARRHIKPQSINVALNALRYAAARASSSTPRQETFVDRVERLPVEQHRTPAQSRAAAAKAAAATKAAAAAKAASEAATAAAAKTKATVAKAVAKAAARSATKTTAAKATKAAVKAAVKSAEKAAAEAVEKAAEKAAAEAAAKAATKVALKAAAEATAEAEQDALTWEEGQRLIATCGGARGRDLRDNAIITLGLRTGMLRFSMCQLVFEDVEPRPSGTALTFTKKGGGRHTIVLDDITNAALRGWMDWLIARDEDKGYVFRSLGRQRVRPDDDVSIGQQLTPDGLYRALQQRAKEAGLGDLQPHILRKTFLVWVKRAGARPQQIEAVTGHKSDGIGDNDGAGEAAANLLLPGWDEDFG